MNPAKFFASPPCRRTAKVGQSCDSGAVSKSKCGRQHPRCQSCFERRRTGSYTHLKRLERESTVPSEGVAWPRLANSACSPEHQSQNVTTAEPSSCWREKVTDKRSVEDDRLGFGVMGIENSSLDFSADVDAQGGRTSSQKLPVIPRFDYDFNNDLDLDALCASSTPSALLACMPNELSDTALERDATMSTQDSDELSAGMGDHSSGILSPAPNYPSKTLSPKDSMPCSNHTRTCMVSALKILQALHIPSSICLSASAETSDSSCPQPRMTDAVLSTNKEAAQLVSDMLECTCSLSSQVQLVLVIICGKLTAWYRAMVRNRNDSFDNSSSRVRSGSNDNDNLNHEVPTECVIHQPFTVGEYSFDVTLENKIRAQVVFSELQQVESLIENLSRRVEETKFGNVCDGSRVMTPDETGLAETVHSSVTVFLHKQLQAAKAEISL